jgi:acyl-coenzyme A thioesterase PaaI-like protein
MMKLLLRIIPKARLLRWVLNIYRPLRGASIRVMYLADDFSQANVRLRLHWYNKNYVGTHFGGSIYAMTDPFYMLLVLEQLGSDYIVWDKSSHIDYIAPGKSTLSAEFKISAADIASIKQHTAHGEKYLPVFHVDIKDAHGELIASVSKTLYVRKKQSRSLQPISTTASQA